MEQAPARSCVCRKIRERGYENSEETCARFIAQLRRAEARGKPPFSVPRGRRGSIAELSPTPKNVAALFVRRDEKLSQQQKEYLGRLRGADEAPANARGRPRADAELRRFIRMPTEPGGYSEDCFSPHDPHSPRPAGALPRPVARRKPPSHEAGQ